MAIKQNLQSGKTQTETLPFHQASTLDLIPTQTKHIKSSCLIALMLLISAALLLVAFAHPAYATSIVASDSSNSAALKVEPNTPSEFFTQIIPTVDTTTPAAGVHGHDGVVPGTEGSAVSINTLGDYIHALGLDLNWLPLTIVTFIILVAVGMFLLSWARRRSRDDDEE